jgi:DNA-binding MarR family transcriptional regulator
LDLGVGDAVAHAGELRRPALKFLSAALDVTFSTANRIVDRFEQLGTVSTSCHPRARQKSSKS